MSGLSCEPTYSYRPQFTPSYLKCVAPGFAEHRSRLFEGEMFFRSKAQGPTTNDLQLEINLGFLNVYFDGILVEQFPAFLGPGGIGTLRTVVNNPITGSKYIEMPILNYDIFDLRATEDDILIGLTPFLIEYMKGGSGPPTNAAGLAGIRTGPDRSIIIITTTEADDGSPTTPDVRRRVRQWNGSAWVTYSNIVPHTCPFEGTS